MTTQLNKIEVTNGKDDRLRAAKATEEGGKKKVVLEGPVSEIVRRVLNILYHKDSNFADNYSLESGQPVSGQIVETHTVDALTLDAPAVVALVQFAMVTASSGAEGFILLMNQDRASNAESLEMVYGIADHFNLRILQAEQFLTQLTPSN